MAKQDILEPLPADVLLYITELIVPASIYTPVARRADDIATRTLLSLTLTSRIIYPTARRLLYSHCLYIDTPFRLHALLRVLSDPSERSKPSASAEALLPFITSLYLEPYESAYLWDEDYCVAAPVATAVHDLLSVLGLRLRRLVMDIHLRRFYGSGDIRHLLRPAFSNLPSLQEFCSVQDELYLDTAIAHVQEPLLWSLWPKLRSLTLYNVDVSSKRFWNSLRRLGNIETVVLTRSDALQDVDIKRMWREQFKDEETEARALSIVLIEAETEEKVPLGKDSWNENDEVQVRQVNVPVTRHDACIRECQQWIQKHAVSGEPVAYWT